MPRVTRDRRPALPLPDPLARLLRDAARRTADPAVRRWLAALARDNDAPPPVPAAAGAVARGRTRKGVAR